MNIYRLDGKRPPSLPRPPDEVEAVWLTLTQFEHYDREPHNIPELAWFALTRLKRDERDLLLMKDGHNITFLEIHELTGVGIAALEQRARRARKKFIEAYELVWKALVKLEADHRKLFILKELFGLTTQEIIALLHKQSWCIASPTALEKRVQQARYKFNKAYKEVARDAAQR